MRFLKVLGLVLLFLISMMFFIQNTEILSQEMSLHLNFYIGDYVAQSRPLPFYFLLLAAFAIGALLVLLFFVMDKLRMGKLLKECTGERERLEQEVNSLRNLPLDNDKYSSSSASYGGSLSHEGESYGAPEAGSQEEEKKDDKDTSS